MPIEHLSASDAPERVAEVLVRDGCAVVDRLAEPDALERLGRDMAPYIEATAPGKDEFSGHRTRRTGALMGRSPAAREFALHPLVLGAVEKLLVDATNYQLHLSQVIAIGPGEPAQSIHRDQWAFDFFPFPKGFEVQCNTLWALTDFSAENGATRVIPGSHRYDDKLQFGEADTEPAEMELGSVLLYTGALYHGGGANHSDAVRMGLNLTYARAWLRQEENQYLSVPPDVARELPVKLLRLMGYARGAYALGYIDDLRDPLSALRPERRDEGLGDLERARSATDARQDGREGKQDAREGGRERRRDAR
jgi:ectoine hydroxylase-related dioxygenase (phytanoyl-CoA dioxygenase family)